MPACPFPFVVRPVTPSRWPDLERLFGPRGAYGGCWCMFFRQTRGEFARDRGAANREALAGLVQSGAPVGLLAYSGREAVGWCAVAPRSAYSALERSRLFKPVDDLPVWSVTCFFVARTWRRKGVTVALLEGAAQFARRKRAAVLEGYPVVVPRGKRAPEPYIYQGTLGAYREAGFEVVRRPSAGRALVRRYLTV